MKQNFYESCLKFWNRKRDDRGASLIVVIVAIAFVGMLVAMCAHMSYYNYAMKYADRRSKDNFYSAEEALAEINIGLQGVISGAMATAYTEAQSQTISLSADSRQLHFQQRYEEELLKALKDPTRGDRYYSVDTLEGFLVKTKYVHDVGAKITTQTSDPDPENTIFSMNGGIILQNVSLMYTDPRGYVTYLSTDISIELPPLSLASNSGVPELENCTIIANDELDVINNNNIRISGNVYGGKQGVYAYGDTKLLFDKKDSDTESASYKLIAGNLVVDNSTTSAAYAVEATKNYDLWTEDIIVSSGKLSLAGSSYVQDDLTVEGKRSKVTLAGDYYGYGDELYKSRLSSSILINGGETTLDFSGLNNLLLSGHAYVGARHYDANLTGDDYVDDPDAETTPDPSAPTDLYAKNTKDLMMGESIGVKSNQLMYMVPKECMGYYKDSTEQYLAKNPLSYNEFLTLTTTLKADGTRQFDEVNLGIVMNKTGQTPTGSGASYSRVFRKVGDTVLVYYYLDFASENAANEFFKTYYENDKDNVDEYIKSYIKDLKLNSSLRETNSNLHLAGNAIKFDASGNIELVEDTATANIADASRLDSSRSKWADTYLGYSKKMMSNTNSLTDEEKANDIFYNLVKPYTTISSLIAPGLEKRFVAGTTQALVVNNKGAATPKKIDSGLVSDGVCLVIATGDVEVDTNFNGLILCGGTLTVSSTCNIVESDAASVRKAMLATNDTILIDGNPARIADFLVDGAAYASRRVDEVTGSGSAVTAEEQAEREEDYIKIDELIKYQNWSKR